MPGGNLFGPCEQGALDGTATKEKPATADVQAGDPSRAGLFPKPIRRETQGVSQLMERDEF